MEGYGNVTPNPKVVYERTLCVSLVSSSKPDVNKSLGEVINRLFLEEDTPVRVITSVYKLQV